MTLLMLLLACKDDAPAPTDDSTPTVDPDLDGDGWLNEDDCEPEIYAIHPEADEACNEVDDNCDGQVDEGVAQTWWKDADGDGYGGSEESLAACERPEGFAAGQSDCDDGDASVHPEQEEDCDGVDDNCVDGITDEVMITGYDDMDGDGFGDPSTATPYCELSSGIVADSTDCDDANEQANPDAVEVCDGADNDCDSEVDEGLTTSGWIDGDGDGFGAGASSEYCELPSGVVDNPEDCDDGAAGSFPGAEERCDDLDNDCDGDVDDDAVDVLTFFADADGDGFGDATVSTTACDAPSGTSTDDTDCDDGDGNTWPGATELCDAVDNDCDTSIDEGVLGVDAACPAADCAEILAADPSAADGSYVLDDGTYECDMSTDGGGWTLVKNDAPVYGTTYSTSYYNSEGFTWSEVLFAYDSGSVSAHCAYPGSLTLCNNLGFQFASESWGVPLNWGSSVCSMSTTDYTAATTYIGGYDFTVARSSSTDTIRLGALEGISSCTTGDNSGTAYVDIYVRP